MIKCGVYSITNNINGKIYVGSSKAIQRRWSEHKRYLRSNKHHSDHLQKAWNKYGEENFKFSVIEEVVDLKVLREIEQYYLDKHHSYNGEFGYNERDVADPCNGFNHTYITKQKISKSHEGKKLSEEHKRKISFSIKGRKHSEESKKKISEKLKGRQGTRKKGIISENEKQLRRNMMLGQNNHMYGKNLEYETRKKISLSLRGPVERPDNLNELVKNKGRSKTRKLSEDNIREIRKLAREGMPFTDIAKLFSINRTTASRTATYKTNLEIMD